MNARAEIDQLIVERNALRLDLEALESRMDRAAALLERSPRSARDIDDAIDLLRGREEP